MKSLLTLAFLLLSLTTLFAQPKPKGLDVVPDGERRLALVIGNKDYKKGSELTSPGHDADDIAEKLEALGFTVIKRQNLGRLSLEAEIDAFAEKLGKYNVGLFYYSGHGIRGLDGQNYLVPVDEHMSYQTQVPSQCVSLSRLLDGMAGANPKVSLVFLDACRDNKLPTIQKGPGMATGLVAPNNPPGSFVAFATRDSKPAIEVPGDRNSLFTSELLKQLSKRGWGIRAMVDETTRGVMERCVQLHLPLDRIQVPGRYDELLGDFVFVQTQPASQPEPTPPVST